MGKLKQHLLFKGAGLKLHEHEETLKSFEETINALNHDVIVNTEHLNDGKTILSISGSKFKDYSDFLGVYHKVNLFIWPDGKYEVRINVVDKVESGTIKRGNTDNIRELIRKICTDSPYVVCKGLTSEKYQNLFSKLGYQPKKLSVNRHANCSIWYIPDIRPRRADLSESCLKCRTLAFKLDETISRSKNAPHASIRRSAKSRHRIDFISPSSKKPRVKNVRRERQYFQTIAKKYWKKSKVQLNDEQSNELLQLVEAVQCHGEDELENIYEEAEKSGTGRGKVLREV